MPDHRTAPGVVPAVVGKLIVAIVLKQDVSAGPPQPMGTALGVVAAPTDTSLTTTLLAATAPPPLPKGKTD
jgi:hypothetical protein